jgi:hypothetical protein
MFKGKYTPVGIILEHLDLDMARAACSMFEPKVLSGPTRILFPPYIYFLP